MSIKAKLIEAAITKEGLPSAGEKSDITQLEERVKKLWKTYSPDEKTVSIGAVDGSLNRKVFLGFILYAVGATSVFFENGKEDSQWEDYLVDVDILKPQEYSEARLRIYMGILEIKELLKIEKKKQPQILLLDGSLIGDIIRPVVFSQTVEKDLKNRIEEELFPELIKSFSEDGINSKCFEEKILKTFPREFFPVVAGYLEYLEYLLSLSKLMENSFKNIIAISKRSSSRIYNFDSVMPDIFIFQHFNLPPGYSDPVPTQITPETKYQFPELFKNSFRDYRINIFYVKFENFVYKVETALSPKEVMNYLNHTTVNGYPYPLKSAHDKVKIGKSDMDTLSHILSIDKPTGREGVDTF